VKPWLGPLAVALVCAVGVVVLSLRPEPAALAPAVASEDAIALLDGLRPGTRVAGWAVLGIDGPREEAIRIDYGHADVRFAITVSPLGTVPDSPPMHTDLWAIYYGHVQPADATIPPAAIRALLGDVARRLRKTERDVTLAPRASD
jgi:hypothetical protein